MFKKVLSATYLCAGLAECDPVGCGTGSVPVLTQTLNRVPPCLRAQPACHGAACSY